MTIVKTRVSTERGAGEPLTRLLVLASAALLACSTPVEGSGGGATSDDSGDSGAASEAGSSGDVSGTSAGSGSSSAGSSGNGGGGSSGSSGGSTTTTTTAGGMSCDGVEELALGIDDADVSGPWEVDYSNSLDQEFLRWEGSFEDPEDNAIVFRPQIPCDDDWHVWVLFRDNGQYDSFFVQSDGAPANTAIFDGDCDFENDGRWIYQSRLNWFQFF